MMIPIGILQRVSLIKYKDASGSCLGLVKNRCIYLITARHVISDMKNGITPM